MRVEAIAVATVVVAVVAVVAVAAVTVAVAAVVTVAGAAGVKTAKAVATSPVRMTARTAENPGTESDSRVLTVAGRTTPQK